MKRKVVQHGPSTLTVSVPSSWAKRNNVKPGDELDIIEDRNRLSVIKSSGNAPEKSIKIDLSGLSDGIVKSIVTVLYKSGYSHLELTCTSPSTTSSVAERVNSTLIGFEVIDMSKTRCVVESYTLDEDKEFDKVMRRILFVTVEMLRRSYSLISKEDDDKEILSLELMSNRLTSLLHRLINKRSYMDEKSIYIYHISWITESICDDLRDLLRFIGGMSKSEIERLKTARLKHIVEIFERYIELFYKFSLKDTDELRSGLLGLLKEYENLKPSNSQEAVFEMYCFNLAKRIYDCLGSTIGLHY